jgi:hypothetical protein
VDPAAPVKIIRRLFRIGEGSVDIHINYLAVLVAAVACFLIGWLWHTVLFGKIWIKLMGFDKLDKKKQQAMMKTMGRSMAFNFLTLLVMAYCMAWSVQSGAGFYHVSGVVLGLQTGFWLWLGFTATSQLNEVLWGGRPFKLYLINVGQYLVSYLVAGVILAFCQ